MKQISLQLPSKAGNTGYQMDDSTNKSDGENASLELEPNLVDMAAKALTIMFLFFQLSNLNVNERSIPLIIYFDVSGFRHDRIKG